MDLFQFELRFLSYRGLSHKLHLDRSQDVMVDVTRISPHGQLVQSLDKTTPEQLKELTLQTYTHAKKQLIEQYDGQIVKGFSVSEYIHRLEYELKVIHEMGFDTYMLIVQDFINRAKSHHICVWPGRWSWAWSLLARCSWITDVDPLEFGLLFERFLNPARVSMPDIDVDFEDQSRDQVLEYVAEHYGVDHISKIGTFMKMASKAAFKDVARVMGVPFEVSNMISNLLPPWVKLKDIVMNLDPYEDLKKVIESEPRLQKTLQMATVLENNMRQLGVHACGVVIAPGPITDYAVVQPEQNSRSQWSQYSVTQWEYKYLEGNMWLIKMDFLWLINLTVIKNCIKIIRAWAKQSGDALPEMFESFERTSVFEPPLNDPIVFEKVFQSWDTSWIFQFEWDGIRHFLIKLKPTHINDIVAMGALYRPGPMEFIPTYIARKHGEEPINYMHPELYQAIQNQYGKQIADEQQQKLIEDLTPIMDVTYGIAVYQEQLMLLVQRMAWFALAEADNLRRGIGKKIKEVIEKIKGEFVIKAAEYRWYKTEVSTYIYEKMIEPAASYSFNKSHSVAYALIAYQTAYLKAYYPVQFYASLLRSREEDTDRLSGLIDEVLAHGIPVLCPDINQSYNHIAAIGDSVRLWFFCIKGVGFDAWEQIEAERRQHGPFHQLWDFLKRCQPLINKKNLESLIKAGALDGFGDRRQLLNHLEYLIERSKQSTQQQGWLFGDMSESMTLQLPAIVDPASKMDLLLMEHDVLKTFVSGHPFDGTYPYLKKDQFISTFKGIENAGPVRMTAMIKKITRAKKKGFFVEVEDITDSLEFFVKEALDLKKFDILTIDGYKGRSLKISKMVKRTVDELINEAKRQNKYDPDLTVAKVKQQRLLPKEILIVDQPVVWWMWKEATPFSDMTTDEVVQEAALDETHDHINPPSDTQIWQDLLQEPMMIDTPGILQLELPQDPLMLKQLVNLIKQHPGTHAVMLGSAIKHVSEEGLEKIRWL